MSALETASSLLSLVLSVTSASVTRQSFVESSKHPWACLGEKSRLEFVKKRSFYFFSFIYFNKHHPHPLPALNKKKGTISQSHTQTTTSACALPVKVFKDSLWTWSGPGIRMRPRGLVSMCMHVYAARACVRTWWTRSPSGHARSSRGMQVAEGWGSRWDGRSGLVSHMSISDSWHSIRLYRQSCHPALASERSKTWLRRGVLGVWGVCGGWRQPGTICSRRDFGDQPNNHLSC